MHNRGFALCLDICQVNTFFAVCFCRSAGERLIIFTGVIDIIAKFLV